MHVGIKEEQIAFKLMEIKLRVKNRKTKAGINSCAWSDKSSIFPTRQGRGISGTKIK